MSGNFSLRGKNPEMSCGANEADGEDEEEEDDDDEDH